MELPVIISTCASTLCVLLLLLMPARLLARVNCDGVSLIGKPYHPSCCVLEKVDRNSIKSAFIVRSVGSDEWKLDVNISWDRPQGMYFDAYAVYPLDFTRTAYKATNCDDEYSLFSIIESEWFYVDNVPFGYNPYFIIYTANQTAKLINNNPNDQTRIELADCYETTESVSFCQTQEVKITSRPIRLQVYSIIAEEQNGDTHQTAAVTVSWYPPVQINSMVVLTSFYLWLEINNKIRLPLDTVDVPMDQRNYTNPFSFSFNHLFAGVSVNESNSVSIKVQPFTSCIGSLCGGNIAELDIIIRPDNVTTLQMPTPSPDPNILIYVVLGIVALILIGLFVIALALCANRRKEATEGAGVQFIRHHAKSNYVGEAVSKNKPCFAQTECDRNILTELKEIGKGSFGVVYKGFAFGTANGKSGYYPVAIKCIKENATMDMKNSFLEEIHLMIDIGCHQNILTVLGCCTIDEPYHLITEFMKHGDLLHFLWKTREKRMAEEDPVYNLTELGQLQIARQVACGMEYLSQTRYYHGDLAARNILVQENLYVKISDFGLSADTYEMGYKRLEEGKKRAVKWVSLETNTTRRCTIQSDVWSFGIVLYEIFTRGDVPYPGLSNTEVIEKLKTGYRMKKPNDCPADMYSIIRKCWLEKPLSRPSFTMLYKTLDKMLALSSDYLSFEESATSIGGSQNVLIGSSGSGTNNQHNSDQSHQDTATSEFSGKSDELQLWLHLNGPLPEGTRTIDFVPDSQAGDESIKSDTPISLAVGEKATYKRDRDCDILSV